MLEVTGKGDDIMTGCTECQYWLRLGQRGGDILTTTRAPVFRVA